MTNHELYTSTLQETFYLSDIEDVIKVLNDESDTIFSRLDKACARMTLMAILKKFRTDRVCPKCGKLLYLSDLPEYDYLCTDCKENYHESEVN